ncbi:hypothetical protein LTR86_000519 [Recurvomyces mirabilis]|nr:hypothetical protein LTR86_000519 [Recurvomyces mirabilis]
MRYIYDLDDGNDTNTLSTLHATAYSEAYCFSLRTHGPLDHIHHKISMAGVRPTTHGSGGVLDTAPVPNTAPTPNTAPAPITIDLEQTTSATIIVPDADEHGMVAPYDALQHEGRPRFAAYCLSFKAVEDGLVALCKDFEVLYGELKANGFDHPDLENVVSKQLSALRDINAQYPTTGPVACLGPTGIGKSSTMCSLLGQKNVAPDSGSAQRGTSLPHEYAKAREGQTDKYEVSAVVCSNGQMFMLVQMHVKSIMDCLYIEAEEVDSGEIEDCQKKYRTALDFFRTLLADQEEFKDNDTAEEYFNNVKTCDEEAMMEICATLHLQVKANMVAMGFPTSEKVFPAHNDHDLLDIFCKVSKAPVEVGQQPHPWPLIRKVTTKLQVDVLDAGAIVTDLPGTGDANTGVVASTTEYLKHAGTILVFATSLRAAAIETLDNTLLECIAMGKMRNTHLVVTKTDESSRLSDMERLELRPGQRAELEAATALYEDLFAVQRVDAAARKQAKGRKDYTTLYALDEKLEQLTVHLAFAKAKIRQVEISIRNASVVQGSDGLQHKLRKLSKKKDAPDLPIHFVGNNMYQMHTEGYALLCPPGLDVQATGIPGLRRVLYEIPTRGKLAALKRLINHRGPNVFVNIVGILTKTRMELKQEALAVVVKILQSHDSLVKKMVERLRQLFQDNVIGLFKVHAAEWAEKADTLLTSWSSYHSGTFMAFCRRNGQWRIKDNQLQWHSEEWHGQLQAIFVDALVAGFDDLDAGILRLEAEHQDRLDNLFSSLEGELNDRQVFHGVKGAGNFIQYVHSVHDRIRTEVAELFTQLRSGDAYLEQIRSWTVLPSKDSFIGLALEDTYAAARAITAHMPGLGKRTKLGKNAKSRTPAHRERVKLFREKIEGSGVEENLFQDVASRCETAFDEVLKGHSDQEAGRSDGWTAKLKGVFVCGAKDIVGYFKGHFAGDDDEVKAEDDPAAREKLLVAAQEALATLEGPLRRLIEVCEAYEKEGEHRLKLGA